MKAADVSALAVITDEQLGQLVDLVFGLLDHSEWAKDTVKHTVTVERRDAAAQYRSQPEYFRRCDARTVDLSVLAATVVEEFREQEDFLGK